jgi:putative cell wall-binding protein
MRVFLAALLLATAVFGTTPGPGTAQPAASPEGEIALQFEWESTKPYAGQFHDVMQFSGASGTWLRLANEGHPINEDRVSLMLEDPDRPVPNFGAQGCYVTCHADMNDMPEQTVDARHYSLPHAGAAVGDFALDMWHWRGGRSGPMGFAEDTWVRTHAFGTGAQGRQADVQLAATPTNWVRSGGDRLREDLPTTFVQFAWKDTPLPRFVFDKTRADFGHYFLAEDGVAITDVDDLKKITNDQYGSQMVVYQDLDFDAEDKVNSIDIQYLLFRAGVVADPGYRGGWHEFWADRLGIETAEDAEALLDDIVDHVEDGVMVARGLGFIYESEQHDISSTRSFEYDETRGTWTVTLYRALSTGDTKDVDLSALLEGTAYNLAFAVHDIVIDDGVTHHISLPVTLGTGSADISAVEVVDTRNADWSEVPVFQTTLYQPGTISLQHLLDADAHSGGAAGVAAGTPCASCHTVDDLYLQSRDSVEEGLEAPPVPVKVRAVYGFGDSGPIDPPASVEIQGADRFHTAVAASQEAYPDGSQYVIIATGRNWPDALGGTALAGALDAPILLSEPTSLPSVTKTEIERLEATHAIILGGTGAVSAGVQTTLATMGLSVERIAGTTRYQTADAVALRTIAVLGDDYDGTAFVATGGNFPDALAAAPLAAANGWPLYLAHPTSGLLPGTVAAMGAVEEALILGGTGAVSAGVESALDALLGDPANTTRLQGINRYVTAVAIASYGVTDVGHTWDRVGIATGEDYPDALAGGVLQGKVGSVMLLTLPTSLHPATATALTANAGAIDTVTFFGGTGAVSTAVRQAALAAAGIVP